jgi:cytosine permease
VPLSARLGFRDPALVWSGFGIAYICAVIGGLIQQGLGTTNAILAIALGNFVLFLYSAAWPRARRSRRRLQVRAGRRYG